MSDDDKKSDEPSVDDIQELIRTAEMAQSVGATEVEIEPVGGPGEPATLDIAELLDQIRNASPAEITARLAAMAEKAQESAHDRARARVTEMLEELLTRAKRGTIRGLFAVIEEYEGEKGTFDERQVNVSTISGGHGDPYRIMGAVVANLLNFAIGNIPSLRDLSGRRTEDNECNCPKCQALRQGVDQAAVERVGKLFTEGLNEELERTEDEDVNREH